MTWFDPDGTDWTRASTKLIPARLIITWSFLLVVLAGLVVLASLASQWVWIAVGVIVLVGAWASYIIVRQVQAHGWAERDDELLVRRGRMFRRVTTVPYGRMQYVEVQAGPLARSFGIATVQLHTASPGTDAALSGVPADEAARLRDRLAARGEARLAGL